MEELMVILVVGIITWGIYRLFELYARRRERLAMIEKISSDVNLGGLSDSLGQSLFPRMRVSSSWALRGALLMIGIGLGLAVAFFIQYGLTGRFIEDSLYNHDVRHNIEVTMSVVYFACVSFFGGLGLLVAYLIERKER